LARIKQAIYSSGEHSFEEQLDLERDTMRVLGRSADFREGVAAFLEKRPAKFVGH
jgi:2-(1,2-epoxy-1,2-dihydrophenyl)acetyl-CoA isomerase